MLPSPCLGCLLCELASTTEVFFHVPRFLSLSAIPFPKSLSPYCSPSLTPYTLPSLIANFSMGSFLSRPWSSPSLWHHESASSLFPEKTLDELAPFPASKTVSYKAKTVYLFLNSDPVAIEIAFKVQYSLRVLFTYFVITRANVCCVLTLAKHRLF